LLLLAYFLVNSSAAQMMISPTPTPNPATNNLETSFVLIGSAIIVAVAVIAIYFFYGKNKNRKIDTVSESKFTAVRGSKSGGDSKIDTSDKVSRPFEVFFAKRKVQEKIMLTI
jgi:H+/gluconate symporter-like permease